MVMIIIGVVGWCFVGVSWDVFDVMKGEPGVLSVVVGVVESICVVVDGGTIWWFSRWVLTS